MNEPERTARPSLYTPSLFTEEALLSYWQLLGWPTLIALAVILSSQIAAGDVRAWQIGIVETVLFVSLVVLAGQQWPEDRRRVMVVCGMAGFLTGLTAAILKLVYGGSFYLVFNLLTEPVWTLLAGSLLAWLVSHIGRRRHLILHQASS